MVIKLRKILYLVLAGSLFFQQIGFAQMTVELNIAGYLAGVGSGMATDKFRPMHLRYFEFDPSREAFNLLLDKGDDKDLADSAIEESTKELMKYFFIGLTLPNDSFWVNLRPDTEEQIIDSYLEKTDAGKIMLEADLRLKKDIAAMTSPATPEGREYWDKLYKKAEELYGSDNVTIPTLTRPWIVPGEIILKESRSGAYVYKATLKVMLEQDYLKGSTAYNFKDERAKVLNEYSSQLIRELIIPKLTREVNSAKRYSALRQVYYSLIISRWFKLRYAGTGGSYASLIDTRGLTGLISEKSWSKTDYFKQYQKSFSDGEYNIQEPVYTPTGQVIRSYFSGGTNLTAGLLPGDGSGAGGNNLAGTFSGLGLGPGALADDPKMARVRVAPQTSETAAGPPSPQNDKGQTRRGFIIRTAASVAGGLVLAVTAGCNFLNSPLALRPGETVFQLGDIDGTSSVNGYGAVVRKLENEPGYEFTYTGVTEGAVNDAPEIRLGQRRGYIQANLDGYLTLSGDFNLPDKPNVRKIGVQLVYEATDGVRYSPIVVTNAIESHIIKIRLSDFYRSAAELGKIVGINLYIGHRVIPNDSAIIGANREIPVGDVLGNPRGADFKLRGISFTQSRPFLPSPIMQNDRPDRNDSTPVLAATAIAVARDEPAAAVPKALGGIDLKKLPMAIQPMGSLTSLDFELPLLNEKELAQIDIDSESQQIKSLVKADIPPSNKRITELVAACVQKKEFGARADHLLFCLADICRLQEENADESTPEFKRALVIADALAS